MLSLDDGWPRLNDNDCWWPWKWPSFGCEPTAASAECWRISGTRWWSNWWTWLLGRGASFGCDTSIWPWPGWEFLARSGTDVGGSTGWSSNGGIYSRNLNHDEFTAEYLQLQQENMSISCACWKTSHYQNKYKGKLTYKCNTCSPQKEHQAHHAITCKLLTNSFRHSSHYNLNPSKQEQGEKNTITKTINT